jgi:nucleoside-diphosphate-sugar epimerase
VFEGKRIWVTGASGFLGQHVVKALLRTNTRGVATDRTNLLNRSQVAMALGKISPDYVVHLAYPGSRGIRSSVEEPLSLAAHMLHMDANIIEACGRAEIPKLLTIGSVCAYPEHTTLPTDESQLWAGYPEPVNAAYGMAKRMQLVLLEAARQQYGLNGRQVMLGNLYGPGDTSGHVIPATIAKIRAARRVLADAPITVWGSPAVTRSFLYVEDAAEGIVRALAAVTLPQPLNLCAHEEVSMDGLVREVAALLHYQGAVHYDASRPTGHLRRRFDLTRLCETLDWFPPTSFKKGLAATMAWTLANVAAGEEGV